MLIAAHGAGDDRLLHHGDRIEYVNHETIARRATSCKGAEETFRERLASEEPEPKALTREGT